MIFMKRTYNNFEYKKSLLHFSKYGRGDKVLLCFHGYGQNNSDMNTLQEVLKEKYTIYTFDLFFHGESFWHEKEKPLSKQFWFDLITAFLITNNIQRFSVAGFSMGAKFALPLVESFYKQIDKIFLIAPDGIAINFWYNLATSFKVTRRLLRTIVVKPGLYIKFIQLLSLLKLAPAGTIRFANAQMATRKQRRRVYYSWVVFRRLRVNSKKLARIINQHNIPLLIFLGSHDKLITEQSVRPLLKHTTNCKKIILEHGHTNLVNSVADYERNTNIV